MQSKSRYIAIISDFVHRSGPLDRDDFDGGPAWRHGRRGPAFERVTLTASVAVHGGYLERLPLALTALEVVDQGEIWDFGLGISNPELPYSRVSPHLVRRTFRLDGNAAPFRSADMIGFIEAFGPPEILCVWGLGIDESILRACQSSTKIYNSIDAPSLRIPPNVSGLFDVILTGAEWQSQEVRRLHPDIITDIMPIGPEFADPETFRPLGIEKDYDVIYVAAAQPYKRHDILFDALERLPRTIRTLCVIGYGDMRGEFEARVMATGLSVDFVGPPGVSFSEVNVLMNRAKIGVVCGVVDGAPAILTEYMLAGLPVLANANLRCGLQYIAAETGAIATAEEFHVGLLDLIARASGLSPRTFALSRWTWPHSGRRLAAIINEVKTEKSLAVEWNKTEQPEL